MIEEDNEINTSKKNKITGKNPPITVRLGKELTTIVKEEAENRNENIRELVRDAVKQVYLDGNDLREENERLKKMVNGSREVNDVIQNTNERQIKELRKLANLQKLRFPCGVCGGVIEVYENHKDWPKLYEELLRVLRNYGHQRCMKSYNRRQ